MMIISGLVALYWKQRVAAEHRFTKLEVLVSNLHGDHAKLEGKIEHMDKSIQQLHGRISKVKESIADGA